MKAEAKEWMWHLDIISRRPVQVVIMTIRRFHDHSQILQL